MPIRGTDLAYQGLGCGPSYTAPQPARADVTILRLAADCLGRRPDYHQSCTGIASWQPCSFMRRFGCDRQGCSSVEVETGALGSGRPPLERVSCLLRRWRTARGLSNNIISKNDGRALRQPCHAAAAVSNDLPGGQQLPVGANVTSVAEFQGRFVAAGSYFPGDDPSAPANCATGCNPVVWTTTNKSRWSVTWTNPASGSITGEEIVTSPTALLLFNDDEGTALWRSTDTVNWEKVPLPADMAAFDISKAEWSRNRFVTILRNKFTEGPNTVYGKSDAIWTSTDGITWERDLLSGPPATFESLSADATGFVIRGSLRQTGVQTVWTSSDGIAWTSEPG